MNKRAQIGIGTLVLIFIGIIVGISLMGQVINDQYSLTNKLGVVDEEVSVADSKLAGSTDINGTVELGPVTNAPSGWKIEDCPLESITVTNASGTELTVTTDYTLSTTTGVLKIVNNSDTIDAFATDNTSLIDYSYCSDGYNKDAGSRGVARLFTLFMAMGILALTFLGIKQWLNK